jgi:conjugative transfer signal peptidase TraF
LIGIRRATIIGVSSVAMLFGTTYAVGVRINLTASLPLGLYVRTEQPTDYIAFCLGGEFEKLALARGYLTPGFCPGGGVPLLKPIVARPGDTVEYSAEGIAVNGMLLVNTAPLQVDHLGRPLEAYPLGAYSVPRGEFVVASSYDARSLDSRYFGAVSATSIRYHMAPLWVAK